MQRDIKHLVQWLKVRLNVLQSYEKQGVIPGQLDTYELEQVKGQVKELKRTIAIAEEIIEEDYG